MHFYILLILNTGRGGSILILDINFIEILVFYNRITGQEKQMMLNILEQFYHCNGDQFLNTESYLRQKWQARGTFDIFHQVHTTPEETKLGKMMLSNFNELEFLYALGYTTFFS